MTVVFKKSVICFIFEILPTEPDEHFGRQLPMSICRCVNDSMNHIIFFCFFRLESCFLFAGPPHTFGRQKF